MAIKEEIKALIKVLQDQLVNFKDIPDERLEAFLELCVSTAAHENEQEPIEDRDLQIAMLCIDADVRSPDVIGHCGVMTDFNWYDDEWLDDDEVEERENHEDEDEDEDEEEEEDDEDDDDE